MVFGGILVRGKSPKVFVLEAEFSRRRHGSTSFLENTNEPDFCLVKLYPGYPGSSIPEDNLPEGTAASGDLAHPLRFFKV
jgi:hypothetical protein